MAATMEKTSVPGIYKRGGRYVFSYRVDGKQRWESAATLGEARKLKAARSTDVARGEFHDSSQFTFKQWAEAWVDRYYGRGKGFRESTRDDYRRSLEKYAIPYMGARRLVWDSP